MSFMKTVKAALLDNCETIVRELVPGGKKTGRVYTARNPARADRSAGSFVVWLRGPAAGAWKDYATGEQGDIIDLICLVKGCERRDALAWAADRCRIRQMSSGDRAALAARDQARREDQAEVERHAEARQVARAQQMFAQATPDAFKQPVIGRYLMERGINVTKLKNIEDDFRFHPAMEWWLGRNSEQGELVSAGKGRQGGGARAFTPGPKFPALVSAMVDGRGVQRGLHLTFLAPDGAAKAPVEKPKLMWPRVAGLVIRVSRGYRNLNAETAAAQSRPTLLALTEGIEDALTISLATPELRVWAAGSLAGLLHVPDHDCASGFLILKDNDWGKPQAAALFSRAVARLQGTGKPVEVIAMPGTAKDANDYLTKEGVA